MVTPPPNAQAVFNRFMRRRGKLPQGGKDFRTFEGRTRKQDIAGDPAWSDWTDWQGNPVNQADVLGASDLLSDDWRKDKDALGGGYYPDEVLSDFTTNLPYEAVPILDEYGNAEWTQLGDFFSHQADEYLDERGQSYRVNPDGKPDWGRAISTTEASSVGTWPAPISISPTSTTNPSRPRTVAAGYDGARKVLTVIFRDGTFYNFYQVDNLVWGGFLRSRSKGKYIKDYLNGHVRGPADVGTIPREHRDLLYKIARSTQVKDRGLQPTHSGYRGAKWVRPGKGVTWGGPKKSAKAPKWT